ncbi:Rtf2 RING-finger-domain-containing protein [Scheffersomyces coipomensis]|uniref:Rtf2 RING-finger-domain-containing protein n=1 Tax=Scheffersomyces coipomensis TaxID=1788519 RepID=UPI00315CDAE5
MGNDGGTIAKRQDILSLHSQFNGSDSKSQQGADDIESTLLTTCAISSLPLYSLNGLVPIVGDYKGRLYIKEKILEYIIKQKFDKSSLKPAYAHIKSLKDLIEVNIKWIKDDESDTYHIQCPVTKESQSFKASYAYLRPCGCVLSYKVLEEVSSSFTHTEVPFPSLCPVCEKEFQFNYDIVIINPLKNTDNDEFNESNYKYLGDVLGLTHSKAIKQKKKSKTKLSPLKRKLQDEVIDDDDNTSDNDSSKRVKV